jgi:hypothetical protein
MCCMSCLFSDALMWMSPEMYTWLPDSNGIGAQLL